MLLNLRRLVHVWHGLPSLTLTGERVAKEAILDESLFMVRILVLFRILLLVRLTLLFRHLIAAINHSLFFLIFLVTRRS